MRDLPGYDNWLTRDDHAEQDETCEHRRIVRRYGGAACRDCGELLVEPDGDEVTR